jgi:hypothetical protein
VLVEPHCYHAKRIELFAAKHGLSEHLRTFHGGAGAERKTGKLFQGPSGQSNMDSSVCARVLIALVMYSDPCHNIEVKS